jgi:hypothetical protein
MEIGVGLPNAIPDVDTESLLEFARRADTRASRALERSTGSSTPASSRLSRWRRLRP